MPEYPLIVLVGKATQVAFDEYEQRKQNHLLGLVIEEKLRLTWR